MKIQQTHQTLLSVMAIFAVTLSVNPKAAACTRVVYAGLGNTAITGRNLD